MMFFDNEGCPLIRRATLKLNPAVDLAAQDRNDRKEKQIAPLLRPYGEEAGRWQVHIPLSM
jgi:hypothetical protein